MRQPSSLLSGLGSLLETVSAEQLLPRFRNLATSDVIGKPNPEDPTDVVTVADRAAELFLTEALPSLVPGSQVIGEEAVAADPAILDRLRDARPVWLVDPLDGTRQFAAGEGPFGPMVALVERGEILLAGIHLSLSGELLLAERGAGAFLGGAPIDRVAAEPGERLVGTVFDKYMPAELAAELGRRALRHERRPMVLCAANEYRDLVLGAKDYAVYYRMMPWDHAPGALLLREAGGASKHPSGRDYDVFDTREVTLAARSQSVWQRVQRELFAEER